MDSRVALRRLPAKMEPGWRRNCPIKLRKWRFGCSTTPSLLSHPSSSFRPCMQRLRPKLRGCDPTLLRAKLLGFKRPTFKTCPLKTIYLLHNCRLPHLQDFKLLSPPHGRLLFKFERVHEPLVSVRKWLLSSSQEGDVYVSSTCLSTFEPKRCTSLSSISQSQTDYTGTDS